MCLEIIINVFVLFVENQKNSDDSCKSSRSAWIWAQSPRAPGSQKRWYIKGILSLNSCTSSSVFEHHASSGIEVCAIISIAILLSVSAFFFSLFCMQFSIWCACSPFCTLQYSFFSSQPYSRHHMTSIGLNVGSTERFYLLFMKSSSKVTQKCKFQIFSVYRHMYLEPNYSPGPSEMSYIC